MFLRWTKKSPIFDKEYLFIPINEHLHWSLVVVYMPGEWAKEERKRRGFDDAVVGEGDAVSSPEPDADTEEDDDEEEAGGQHHAQQQRAQPSQMAVPAPDEEEMEDDVEDEEDDAGSGGGELGDPLSQIEPMDEWHGDGESPTPPAAIEVRHSDHEDDGACRSADSQPQPPKRKSIGIFIPQDEDDDDEEEEEVAEAPAAEAPARATRKAAKAGASSCDAIALSDDEEEGTKAAVPQPPKEKEPCILYLDSFNNSPKKYLNLIKVRASHCWWLGARRLPFSRLHLPSSLGLILASAFFACGARRAAAVLVAPQPCAFVALTPSWFDPGHCPAPRRTSTSSTRRRCSSSSSRRVPPKPRRSKRRAAATWRRRARARRRRARDRVTSACPRAPRAPMCR